MVIGVVFIRINSKEVLVENQHKMNNYKETVKGGLLVTKYEVMERAQQGDKEAYKELIRSQQQTVEKFAYQCGVHTNHLADVAQAVFVKLYRFLPQCTQEQFRIQLFKTTLHTIKKFGVRDGAESDNLKAQPQASSVTENKHVLRFEEDQLLHQAIQTLDVEDRHSFVLFYFHQLTYEEISEVLESSVSTVKACILRAEENLKTALALEGFVKMDNKQFDKRLELLKKSYDRLPSSLNPDDVIVQMEAEEKSIGVKAASTSPKCLLKWKKSTIWIASMAGVLLLVLLVKHYLFKQPENEPSELPSELVSTSQEYDEWLKSMLVKYDRKREEVRKELLVSADELASFGFIRSADAMMSYYETGNHGYEVSTYLENVEENLLHALMTPRQAIELIDSYDQLSFEESYHIYELYQQSIEELNAFYSQLVEPYAYLLAVPTEVSQFPRELQVIIKAANRQFLELQLDEEGVRFKANPIDGEFAPAYIHKIHPDSLGYFEYTKNGYLLLVKDLRYSREETLQSLKLIERTLLVDENEGKSNYAIIKANYENAWLALLKGTLKYPVKTTNQFDEQYVQFLQETAAGKYGVVMEEIAAMILKEIQEKNRSETLEKLSVERIWGALLQMREVPTDEDLTNGHLSVVVMSESLKEQIQALYTQYTKSFNETLINELHPVNLGSLYIYASIKGDQRVLQSLTMGDLKINTNGLQQIQHLEDVSEMSVSNGFHPVVAIRLTTGNQFRIILSVNGDGQYRIREIID